MQQQEWYQNTSVFATQDFFCLRLCECVWCVGALGVRSLRLRGHILVQTCFLNLWRSQTAKALTQQTHMLIRFCRIYDFALNVIYFTAYDLVGSNYGGLVCVNWWPFSREWIADGVVMYRGGRCWNAGSVLCRRHGFKCSNGKSDLPAGKASAIIEKVTRHYGRKNLQLHLKVNHKREVGSHIKHTHCAHTVFSWSKCGHFSALMICNITSLGDNRQCTAISEKGYLDQLYH